MVISADRFSEASSGEFVLFLPYVRTVAPRSARGRHGRSFARLFRLPPHDPRRAFIVRMYVMLGKNWPCQVSGLEA